MHNRFDKIIATRIVTARKFEGELKPTARDTGTDIQPEATQVSGFFCLEKSKYYLY